MALALKIEHLSKLYRLGVINNGVLWKDIQSYLARWLGKEDPNAPIGAETWAREDDFWALSDINLAFEQGDRIGIMGRNGAGKSTLLKILSRITTPTTGCFHVKGRIASLLEVGTGFHGELTGRENIFMNGAILGMKRREVAAKLDEIIDYSEISPRHIDTPVKRYSSGMHVRLGFAIAAHLDCEIMIADEVLAVGDLRFRHKALSTMKDLSFNRGRTVLFVSHSPGMLAQLCNKGLVLNEGRVYCPIAPLAEAQAAYKEILGLQDASADSSDAQ